MGIVDVGDVVDVGFVEEEFVVVGVIGGGDGVEGGGVDVVGFDVVVFGGGVVGVVVVEVGVVFVGVLIDVYEDVVGVGDVVECLV